MEIISGPGSLAVQFGDHLRSGIICGPVQGPPPPCEQALRNKHAVRQESDQFSYSTLAVSVLFFSIIERSVFMALTFY